MKLIEVVVLMGAQCISPVEHTGTATEAAKVQCAVVIEKDTDANTLRIVPAGASNRPEVVAVLQRLDGVATAIEPAAAPPPPPAQAAAPVIAPPPAQAAAPAIAPPPDPAVATAAKAQEPPPPVPAKAPKPKQASNSASKTKPVSGANPSQEAKVDSKSQCRGEAKPKWYTNAEGRRKYRCVVPG